jgi:hypothetical protein
MAETGEECGENWEGNNGPDFAYSILSTYIVQNKLDKVASRVEMLKLRSA